MDDFDQALLFGLRRNLTFGTICSISRILFFGRHFATSSNIGNSKTAWQYKRDHTKHHSSGEDAQKNQNNTSPNHLGRLSSIFGHFWPMVFDRNWKRHAKQAKTKSAHNRERISITSLLLRRSGISSHVLTCHGSEKTFETMIEAVNETSTCQRVFICQSRFFRLRHLLPNI